MPADALAQLERIRRFRGRRERETAIGPLVEAIGRDIARQQRAVGGADDVWRTLMPPALVEASRVVSFARGTLVVGAESSSVAFEIDRALRAGIEGELRAALRCGSLRVRVRVGG